MAYADVPVWPFSHGAYLSKLVQVYHKIREKTTGFGDLWGFGEYSDYFPIFPKSPRTSSRIPSGSSSSSNSSNTSSQS